MIGRFSVSILGRILAALMQAAVIALLARGLEVEQFGIYGVVVSICLVVMAVFEFGLGNRVLRLANDPARRGVVGTAVILRASLSVSLPLLAWLLAATLSTPIVLAIAAVVSTIGETSGNLGVGILQGEKRTTWAMSMLLARRVAALIPFAFGLGASQALASLFAGGLVGILVFFAIAIPRASRPRSLWRLIRENGAIILVGGAGNLSQIDVFLVGAVRGAVEAGFYAAAVRLFNPINIGIGTLMQVLIPELAAEESVDRRHRLFRRSRVLVGIASVCIVVFAAASPLIVDLLYGPAFAPSAPIVAAVIVSAGLSSFAQLHLAWFYASSVPKIVPVGMWVATLCGLTLITVLGSMYSVWGLAVGFLSMYLISTCWIVAAWHVHGRPRPDSSDPRPTEST